MSKLLSTLFFTAFCCDLALLGGCTSKLPATVALSDVELTEAHTRIQHFLNKSCVTALDSDVRLGLQVLGENKTYPATLQLAAPASLRLALTDPLGRPLFLLTADNASFTFVDNLHGQGYTGATQSDFVFEYLPQGINPKDIFYWLSGRLRSRDLKITTLRKGVKDQFFWYEFEDKDGRRHLLGLDAKNLRRHLVVDSSDTLLVNVAYSLFTETPKECNWPGKVVVTGNGLSPDYSVEILKTYSFSEPDAQIFRLRLPPHFVRHTVQ